MFALSAVAVEREMVGNDSDAELICCDGELIKACCCAAAAASSAEVALCASLFDLGDVVKKCAMRLARDVDGRRGMPPFSLGAGRAGVDDGEKLAKGFVGRRGIATQYLHNEISKSWIRV